VSSVLSVVVKYFIYHRGHRVKKKREGNFPMHPF
jgi:hypothetical protein